MIGALNWREIIQAHLLQVHCSLSPFLAGAPEWKGRLLPSSYLPATGQAKVCAQDPVQPVRILPKDFQNLGNEV